MKAIVYTKYGTPDVLELREIDKPVLHDDEVMIKVFAVSLNDWDLGLLEGDFVNRMLNGVRKPKIKILGSDVAGRIEMVGKNVKKFRKATRFSETSADVGEALLNMFAPAKTH